MIFLSEYERAARKEWPGCKLCCGDGKFAIVALCCRPVRVWLFETSQEAAAKLRALNEWPVGCYGRQGVCSKCKGEPKHEVHKLEPPVSFADRMEPDRD